MMQKSDFKITQMDCPSEERLIRMRLEQLPSVQFLAFDLEARTLAVYHAEGYAEPLSEALATLQLGSKLIGTTLAALLPSQSAHAQQETAKQRRILKIAN